MFNSTVPHAQSRRTWPFNVNDTSTLKCLRRTIDRQLSCIAMCQVCLVPLNFFGMTLIFESTDSQDPGACGCEYSPECAHQGLSKISFIRACGLRSIGSQSLSLYLRKELFQLELSEMYSDLQSAGVLNLISGVTIRHARTSTDWAGEGPVAANHTISANGLISTCSESSDSQPLAG